MSLGQEVAQRLRVRAAGLADALLAAARDGLARRLRAQGLPAQLADSGVTVRQAGLRRRRRGNRARLADPQLLWPGEG